MKIKYQKRTFIPIRDFVKNREFVKSLEKSLRDGEFLVVQKPRDIAYFKMKDEEGPFEKYAFYVAQRRHKDDKPKFVDYVDRYVRVKGGRTLKWKKAE